MSNSRGSGDIPTGWQAFLLSGGFTATSLKLASSSYSSLARGGQTGSLGTGGSGAGRGGQPGQAGRGGSGAGRGAQADLVGRGAFGAGAIRGGHTGSLGRGGSGGSQTGSLRRGSTVDGSNDPGV